MTKQEYDEQLRAYTVKQMATLTEGGHHSPSFWADFNNKCQSDFDASLTAQGIVVE
jgi:hypothetical protein